MGTDFFLFMIETKILVAPRVEEVTFEFRIATKRVLMVQSQRWTIAIGCLYKQASS